MKQEKVKKSIDASGVAILTVDNPPMNAFHPSVLKELSDKLKDCHGNDQVKAILITGASGKFSAGFDIQQFQSKRRNSGELDIDIMSKAFTELIESGEKPTVAAIDGICLGGGCELAMACNVRVCTPSTKIGLPELQLGIIPGSGGTQRLPRLVGIRKGMEMMLLSKSISGSEAKEVGLVDTIVSKEKLIPMAISIALDIVNARRPRIITLEKTNQLEPFIIAAKMFEIAHAQSKQKAPHLEHPHLCIEAIRYGVEHGGQKGLVKEKELFAECMKLDTHKALVHVFFSMRSTKRVKGVTDLGLIPRSIKRVGVLGGGLMGSGIVTSLILGGFEVLLKETNEDFLKGGLKRVEDNLKSLTRRGRISKDFATKAFSLVHGVLDFNEFYGLDMVIEAVFEDIALKQQIFFDLEKNCRPSCILATNTSTIDIELVGQKTDAADRIVGAHFFSPAHLMPLLEVVRSNQTSKQVLVDLLEFSSKIKKTPVLVGNCTGFAVNRVFFPYTMAAYLLVDLGLDPYRIDKAIQSIFGMPYGPFRMGDLAGLDVGMHVGKNFIESFPERVYISRLVVLMNEKKRLGEKTKKGFYKYRNGRKAEPDPEIADIVAESRASAGFMQKGPPFKLSDQDIIEFILFPVVNEGCRVIAEGVVSKPSDLDIASILGMAFPGYRGGLMFWADSIGVHHVHDRLVQFSKLLSKQASFFFPCPYLQECALKGSSIELGPQVQSRM